MINILAEKIDADLHGLNGDAVKGEVHSVFRRVVNLVFEDGVFVSLLLSSMYMVPFGVRVRRILPFEDIFLRGRVAIRDKDGILVWSGSRVRIPLSADVELWDAKLPVCKFDVRLISDRLMNVLDFLRREGKGELSHLLFDGKFFQDCEDVAKLLRCFVSEVAAGRRGSFYVRKMLGRGVGLTPSLDDWIGGFSSAYCVFLGDAPWLGDVKDELFYATTAVSAHMLFNLYHGKVPEVYQRFWSTFVDGGSVFYKAMSDVVGVGATSGSDWLTGVAMALEILIKGGIVSVS